MLIHIAGGKRGGDFNMRFGQPSASLPSHPFPFNEIGATDPVSGRSDGLLERLAANGCLTNASGNRSKSNLIPETAASSKLTVRSGMLHRRLQQEGRRSKVNHRTAAQRRFEIREPRTSATS
jgi:hypothetical protein